MNRFALQTSIKRVLAGATMAVALASGTAAAQTIVSATGTGGFFHVNANNQPSALIPAFSLAPQIERRVTMGDVNGDGVPDTIVGLGPGATARVRIFDGATGQSFAGPELPAPFNGFTGGVFVAAGDLDGDGRAEIVVGTDQGTPATVLVFDGASGQLVRSFTPFGTAFQGGVRVATGDVNGDGTADIITGAGPGAGPHVKVFSGQTSGDLLLDFDAYHPSFAGGVFVASGDLNGDGRAEIVTGPGPGGDPIVRIFNPLNMAQPLSRPVPEAARSGGVRVGTVFEPAGRGGQPQNLVVIAIIAILIGLLLPAVQKVGPDGDIHPVWIAPPDLANQHAYVAGAPMPPPPPCRADYNRDGRLDPDDLADYIACYFQDAASPGSCAGADVNADATTNPDDLADFIAAYFSGCR